MNYLLDTCVISELARKRPEPRVVAWIDSLPAETIYLSVITVGEIQKGIDRLPADSSRRAPLQRWLDEELMNEFGERLCVVDARVMRAWGQLAAELDAAGTSMPAIDALVAATALAGGFTLVTRNVADFAHAPVVLFNPWQG